jgi:signal transduction histidine kinase
MTEMEPILPEERVTGLVERLLSLSRSVDRESLLRELVEAAKVLTGSREGRVVVAEASGSADAGLSPTLRSEDASRIPARPAPRPASEPRGSDIADTPRTRTGTSGDLNASGSLEPETVDDSMTPPRPAPRLRRLMSSTARWGLDAPSGSDAAAASHPARQYDFLARSEKRDYIEVPIVLEGEELGALVVWDRGEGKRYSQEQRKVAELLAAQAGVALGFIRLKEEREKWLERMVQLDSQKSAFIAIASHELRTPLGLILGYSTYLREAMKKEASTTRVVDVAEGDLTPPRPAPRLKAPWLEELDTIVSSAMRLKEIVDSLAGSDNVERGLALVRGGEFSLREVVKEALEGIREEAGRKRIRLKSEFGKGGLTVEGDRGKVRTALGNLVNNAVTYSEKGGHVTVRVDQNKNFVTVVVTDDGIGIPAKDLEHIFERFYQVEGHMNRKHGGLGLGLSLARENVELHGGRIWAESEEGKGSRFCFELPVRQTNKAEGDLRRTARRLLEG